MNDYIHTIEHELEKEGVHLSTTVGDSMYPLLRNRKDIIVIEKPKGQLKRYDVPLYKRPDGKYVLHRILKVRKDGYVICGDNRYYREYCVPHSWVIGVMKGCYRGEKYIDCTDLKYKCYVHLWCDFFYIRAGILFLYRFFRRCIRAGKIKR